MNPYPKLLDDPNTVIRAIVQERTSDIADFNNLKNVFVSGRTVYRAIPTSSTDILPTDRPGDQIVTLNFIYFCVNNGGTAVWVRHQLQTW